MQARQEKCVKNRFTFKLHLVYLLKFFESEKLKFNTNAIEHSIAQLEVGFHSLTHKNLLVYSSVSICDITILPENK